MTKLGKVEACIIGSGAGGGVVAKELGERGVSVVVLEAGRRFNPLEDYSGTASNDWEEARDRSKFRVPALDTHVNASNYPLGSGVRQVSGVGGTTLVYLAYQLRLPPDDFRIYTLDGVGADWPITYEDLAPYYRKVELELGVSGQNGDPWGPPIEPYPNPPFEFSYSNKILKRGFDKLGIRLWPAPRAILSRPFDGRPACVGAGTCASGCLTKAKSSVDVTYIPKAEATGKVEVRPESVAIRIEVDARGRAKSVIYVDKDGVEHEQEAEVIIVSAGTVQSPRLLLASKSSLFPDGLANSSGLVGKNLTDHLGLFSAAVFPERIDSFRGIPGGAYSADFAQTAPTNAFARGWRLELNSGGVVGPGPAGMADFIPGWGAWHKDYMRRYFGHVTGMVAGGEQLPDERNRVELDPEVVDDYGVPVPRITLEPRENDKLMLVAMEKNLREIYEAAGATEILKIRYKPGSVHIVGTCRMGNNPATSVLNRFCQAHDVPNLFVIDGSCFVTNGGANPAHTIQAIATRAAEHIAEEGRKGNL